MRSSSETSRKTHVSVRRFPVPLSPYPIPVGVQASINISCLLGNAIQAFGNGTDVNLSPKNPLPPITLPPKTEKSPALPDDINDSNTMYDTSIITTCTSVQVGAEPGCCCKLGALVWTLGRSISQEIGCSPWAAVSLAQCLHPCLDTVVVPRCLAGCDHPQ